MSSTNIQSLSSGGLLCVSKLLAKAKNLVKLGMILESPAHRSDPVRPGLKGLDHDLECGELPLDIFQSLFDRLDISPALD